MKKIFLVSLLAFSMSCFAQSKVLKYNTDFVIFEGCDSIINKEKCFKEKSSRYILEQLTDSLQTKLIRNSKKDTITMSIRFFFDEEGNITKESHFYSSVDSISKHFEQLLIKFPRVKPMRDEFDRGVASFVNSFYGFTLDTITNKLLPINDFEPTEVPYAFLDKLPVYKGCEDTNDNELLSKCINSSLKRHLQENFRADLLANGLDLPLGINSIFLFFTIDKTGKIIPTSVRAPHPILKMEGLRLIKAIPDVDSPGYLDGKAVSVPFFLPLKFLIE
ncbi:hypothetical protein FBALC1_14647 [Flavobacteriales bacterium ALC-1]|nr:hypothetical protein FBALC1_14647 [Flavobacteriales bacterium ALC-1]